MNTHFTKSITETSTSYSHNQSKRNATATYRRNVLLVTDALSMVTAIFIAFVFAHVVRSIWFNELQLFDIKVIYSSNTLLFFFTPVLFLLLSFWNRGHYTRLKPFWEEYKECIKAIAVIVGLVGIFALSTKTHFSRLWFFSAWPLVLVTIPAGRLLVRRKLIEQGRWYVNALLISNGHDDVQSARHLEEDSYLGIKITGHISLPSSQRQSDYPLISNDRHPDKVITQLENPHVVITSAIVDNEEYARLTRHYIALSSGGVTILPSMKQLRLYGVESYHLFREDALILRIKQPLSRHIPQFIKRSFDIVVSGVLLIILLPFMLGIAWKVRKDGGAAVFAHERVGQHGTPFKCLKFRSMTVGAEQVLKEHLAVNPAAKLEWETNFKLKDDPRITRIGQFLRKSSLDELPQLWNVLKGEMSLVGPRPIVEAELSYYGDARVDYLCVRPGMTGLWQVSGRSNTDYKRRVALDSWYVRNWSLWYDGVILLKTVVVVFGFKGAI